MHASALAAHPNIAMTAEFFEWEALANLAESLENGGGCRSEWPTSSSLAIAVLIANSGQLAKPFGPNTIIGNKSPLAEFSFDVIERVFSSSPPRYVYCLRSAPEVLRSIKNYPNLFWRYDPVEVNLNRYILSVQHMEEMRRRLPDRLLVSKLSDLVEVTAPSRHFSRIFEFLGMPFTREVADSIDAIPPQNTLRQAMEKLEEGEHRAISDLTPEELAYIRKSPEYRKIANNYTLELPGRQCDGS